MIQRVKEMFAIALKAFMAWIGPSVMQVAVVGLVIMFVTGGGCNTINTIKHNFRMRRAIKQARAEAWAECRQQCKDGSIDDREWRLLPWRRFNTGPEPRWMTATDKFSLVLPLDEVLDDAELND